jgi:hypothetical protein
MKPPRVPGTRKRPDILVGLPVIPDDLDEATKNALALRNATWIEGVCPSCNATPMFHVDPQLPGIAAITFAHADNCPVTELLEASS